MTVHIHSHSGLCSVVGEPGCQGVGEDQRISPYLLLNCHLLRGAVFFCVRACLPQTGTEIGWLPRLDSVCDLSPSARGSDFRFSED